MAKGKGKIKGNKDIPKWVGMPKTDQKMSTPGMPKGSEIKMTIK